MLKLMLQLAALAAILFALLHAAFHFIPCLVITLAIIGLIAVIHCVRACQAMLAQLNNYGNQFSFERADA